MVETYMQFCNHKYKISFIIFMIGIILTITFIKQILKDDDDETLSHFISTYQSSIQGVSEAPLSPDCQSDFAINSVLKCKYNDAKSAFEKYDQLLKKSDKNLKQKDEYYIFLVNYSKAKMHQKLGESQSACKFWRLAKDDSDTLIRVRGSLSAFEDFIKESRVQAERCK